LSLVERVGLLQGGLLNYWALLVSAAVGLAVVPMMLDRLGVERYGLWVALIAAVSLVAEIDLGLSPILTREVAADPAFERHETGDIVSAAALAYLALGLVGGLLLVALGTAASLGFDLPLPRSDALFVFAMAGVLSLAGRALAFSIALLYGCRRFGTANTITAVLSLIGGIGTILVLRRGGDLPAVAAWHATTAVLVATASIIAMRHVRRTPAAPRRSVWRALRPHLRFGMSSQALTLGVNLLWLAALPTVGAVSSSRLIATYDVGRRFPLFLSAVSWRSSEAFFPAASRETRAGSATRRRDLLEAAIRWNLVLVLPFAVLLWLLGPSLLEVWLDEPPRDTVVVLRALATAVAVDAVGAACVQILWAGGQMRLLLRDVGSTTVGGVALTAVLAWQAGAVGAAVALLCTFAVRSALLLRAASREDASAATAIVATVTRGLVVPLTLCGGTVYASAEFVDPVGWIRLGFVGFLGLAAYVLALVLGPSRPEERALLASLARPPGRVTVWLYRRLRRLLRRVGPLRSAWYLMYELVRMAGSEARPTRPLVDRQFKAGIDPWDYARPAEQERHLAAVGMLDAARGSRLFERGLEIGCAEGTFTELLAHRCDALLAVDLSSIALARARERSFDKRVQLEQWDLLHGDDLGMFDLVVAMDVLDYLLRPGDLFQARGHIIRMMVPGGHLLVSTTKQSEVYETAWWRWRIPRGRMINASLESMGGLRTVETRTTEAHTLSLYVRTED